MKFTDRSLREVDRVVHETTRGPKPLNKVDAELAAVTKNLRIHHETKFKYLCGKAAPRADLANRLLTLVQRYPYTYKSVFRYLSKFGTLPKSVSKTAVRLLKEEDLYPAYSAALTYALTERVHSSHQAEFVKLCRQNERSKDPELRAAAFGALEVVGSHTWQQVKRQTSWGGDWWFRSHALSAVDGQRIGEPSHCDLLNKGLRDESCDAAIVAVDLLLGNSCTPTKPTTDIHPAAQRVLKHAGRIGKVRSQQRFLARAIEDALGQGLPEVDWKKLLGGHRVHVSTKVRRWAGFRQTNPSAWANLGDTIVDCFLDTLFHHDATLGGYNLGNIGGVLGNTTTFAQNYPHMHGAAVALHELRLRSELSHPKHRKSGRPTRPVKHSEVKRVSRLMARGFREVWKKW